MPDLDRAIAGLLLLSALLIAVAYYVGLTSDANSVFAGVRSLILAATGRNTAGNFAGYPTQPMKKAA